MILHRPRLRLCLALALISAAVIAYQLALMQILSLVQWHHFAYMIIAVALLGFAAAGTCLSLLRERLMKNFDVLLPPVIFLSGAAMALVTGIAQRPEVRFDSLLLFTGITQLFRILATCFLYFIPFFLAALAIGMIFVHAARDIGKIYFWNLSGSGAGGAAMTGLLWLFPPPVLPGLAAVAAIAAAMLVLPEGLQGCVRDREPACNQGVPLRPDGCPAGLPDGTPGERPPRHWQGQLIAAGILSVLAAVLSLLRPPALVLSDYKSLSRALHAGEAKDRPRAGKPIRVHAGFIVPVPALRAGPEPRVLGKGPGDEGRLQQRGLVRGGCAMAGRGAGVVSGLHDRRAPLCHRDA